MADTRTRILDVAQDLIQRRGINGMSFQDVADAVGIRKPSLYHHFKNKDTLIEALLERYRRDFSAAVASVTGGKVQGRTKLTRYCDLFSATLEAGDHDKACLCGILAAEFLSLQQPNVDGLRAFYQESIAALESIVNEGVSDGSLQTNLSASETAELLLVSLEGALLVARSDGGPAQMKRLIRSLVASISS